MKILLLGGAGLLGSHLAPQLASLGHQVEICDLFVGSIVFRTSKEFVIHSVDTTKYSEMSYLLSKVNPDIIILGTAYHPARGTRYSQYEDCRVQLDSANVLAGLLSRRFKKVIYLSGSDVYGSPDTARPLSEDREIVRASNMTGAAEKCAEDILSHKCSDLGIPFVACRLFDVYGPRVLFTPNRDRVNFLIDSFVKGEQIGLVGANKKRDFIHVADAASAIIGVAKSSFSGVINIGTGEGTSLITLCKELKKHIEILNKPIVIPEEQVKAYSSVANISRLKEAVPKWSPSIKLFDYLPELIEFRKTEKQYYDVNNAGRIIEDQRRT